MANSPGGLKPLGLGGDQKRATFIRSPRPSNPRATKKSTSRSPAIGMRGEDVMVWKGRRLNVRGTVGPDGVIVWRSNA